MQHLRLRADGREAASHFVQIVVGGIRRRGGLLPHPLQQGAGDGRLLRGRDVRIQARRKPAGHGRGARRLQAARCCSVKASSCPSGTLPSTATMRDSASTEGEPLFDEARSSRELPCVRSSACWASSTPGSSRRRRSSRRSRSCKLIEPIDVSLNFDDGERLTLQGLYTVSLDRLRDLDDAAALGLFRAGHLQLAYTMAASLKQIGRLAHIRNRRLDLRRPPRG